MQEPVSTEQIMTGCLQRIADACEKMTWNINSLISENLQLKKKTQHQEAVIRGLRGEITKLKKGA